MKRGQLIVLEGGDGSGKATQTKLLVDALKARKLSVETLSFPRYSNSFYGKLVGRFLSGEFGSLDAVSPYLAAIPYSLDRLDARDQINRWLEEGKIVVIDRYVPSSLAHQGAKEVPEKRGELIQWLEEMEYDENKLPRPDVVIYLHVATSISRELVKKKAIVREYRHDLDIAERHKDHLEKAEEVFLKLSDEKGWKKIECMKDGTLRYIEDIHAELLQIVEGIHL